MHGGNNQSTFFRRQNIFIYRQIYVHTDKRKKKIIENNFNNFSITIRISNEPSFPCFNKRIDSF